MRQIGGRLVALGRLDRRVALAVRPTAVGPCPIPFGRGPACKVIQLQRPATSTERTKMRPIPEAADVTEADRIRCRTLIEAAGFHAVDYEDDGACWERMLADGDCLVLAVWESALFGKPERREWTLARYTEGRHAGRLGRPDDPGGGPRACRDILGAAAVFPAAAVTVGESV